jgi:hypothetical protein
MSAETNANPLLQLVEGGWQYTPSLDADDMTTCAYCNLALEGWESEDNPLYVPSLSVHHPRADQVQ